MSNRNKQKPLIVLVDGSSYLYRAFHALPALKAADGHPTGALYGVINMIKKLMKEYPTPYFSVVFDAKGKTFRHERYKEYKATRPPMPNELQQQIAPLHEMIEALGIPILVVDGVEADDVIGTLVARACEADFEVLVSTGDKDLAQLVNEHVELINTMDNSRLTNETVVEKFGVAPQQIVDYLALTGDKSDNIPGVAGVGPKTAVKWLRQYDSLQGVVDNADQIKGKVGERLRDSLDSVWLSQDLATIKCDVKLDQEPTDLKLTEGDHERLQNAYQRFGFNKWLAELNSDKDADIPQPVEESAAKAENYRAVTDVKTLKQWIKKLRSSKLMALDTETTSIDYMQAELVGMSFAVESGEAAYVPIAHQTDIVFEQCALEDVKALMGPVLADAKILKVGHHIKYDLNVLHRAGIEVHGVAHDTMLQSYVLNSTASRHDLDTLSLKYLGHENITFQQVAGKGAKQVTFDYVPLEQATPYAAEDADMTLQLHQHFWPQLEKLAAQQKVYSEIEIPVLKVLSRVERTGVLIDADLLKQQSQELTQEMDVVQQQAFSEAGCEFNLGSPKQIQEILFDKLGLPILRKTPKGQPSTAEDVLQELSIDYTLPELILQHRSLSKLKSTYTDKLPEQINADTGRVHTSYHQAVASTGRLSSTDPNLQNIPIRTPQGRRIRQAFIAPSGSVILAADYSQIELRIMAHLSGDATLCKAFSEGADIHRATASEVFAVPLESVTDEQRRASKAINFGLIYGMSAFGLAKQLKIERGKAQRYVDLYFERYPGVKAYMERTKDLAREQGYVETLFGRRLYLPEINDRNAQRRQYAERTAINAPMQGTAADIIKRAMIAVDDWIREKNQAVKMIMQVHDELVFEVPKAEAKAISTSIEELMSKAAQLNVPLEVECGIGENWDQAH